VELAGRVLPRIRESRPREGEFSTRRTAHERGPVSAYWLARLFDGLPATAARLREDRIREEVRAANGDLLHIAAMFGLTAKPVWPEQAARQI
jgi:hypothetical protein